MNGRTLLSISAGGSTPYALPIADETPNASKKAVLVSHQCGDRYLLPGIERENGSGYQSGQQAGT
ncbi:MAG: hypothetical protein JO159_08900 [Acidobacteria bacterium]|nr:hypothetical protein [Acidobacteriota bacterium]